MEPPRDDILKMNLTDTMLSVRRLGLLPDVNRMIWNKLLSMGLYYGNPNPGIPANSKYSQEEILEMKRDTDVFVYKLGLLDQVKELAIAVSEASTLSPEISSYFKDDILNMDPTHIPRFLNALHLTDRVHDMIYNVWSIDKGILPNIVTYKQIFEMSAESLIPSVISLGLLDRVRNLIYLRLDTLGRISDTIRYLSGVHRIDYITGTYEGVTRRFYLFYDVHSAEGECPVDFVNAVKVNEWLLQKLNDHTEFIDVFLEVSPPASVSSEFQEKFFSPKYRSKIEAETGEIYFEDSLDQLRKALKSCYDPHTFTECPYPDVRVHFVDLRELHYTGTMYDLHKNFAFLATLFDTSEMSKEHYIRFIMTRYIYKVKSKFYHEWLKTSFPDWKSIVSKILGLAYEINLQTSAEYKQISDYFRDLRIRYGPNFITNRVAVESISNSITYEEAKLIEIITTQATAVLLDIYAIARMFKQFSGRPEYAKNIIFYGGLGHSRLISRFLLDVLGFNVKHTAWSNDEKYQCVDIQNLPWAF